MCGFNDVRDALESGDAILGNYFVPGSSLLTDHIVSKGAQGQLGSVLGQVAQTGASLAGSGAFGAGLQSAGGAAEQAGISALGNGISSAASSAGDSLSNFLGSSGLSSLFGGTPQPMGVFSDAYNAINNAAPAGSDIASAATTPSAFNAQSALPSGLGGGTGGGSSGAGFNLQSLTGTDPGTSAFSAASPSTPAFDTSSFTDPSATLSGSLPGDAGSALGTNTNSLNLAETNAGLPSNITGGKNMGILSNLFAGNGNQAPGSGVINGIGRSLGTYLGTDTNQAGYQGVANAAQQAGQNYQPFLQAGTGAENTLSNLYGNNGQAAQQGAYSNFQNTPGYQFALSQGINQVNADAARKGQLISGNNQQAINNYAQGTASQQYNNYVQQLQQMAGQGISAAGGVGTAGLTGANALAQGSQGNANKNNALYAGLSNALFPSNGINIGGVPINATGNNQGIGSILSSLFQ